MKTHRYDPLSMHRSLHFRKSDRTWVVMRRLEEGQRVYERFPLSRYVSAQDAERAAMARRDELENQYGPPPQQPRFQVQASVKNPTGVPGLAWDYRVQRNRLGNEYEWSAIVATWVDEISRAPMRATYSIKAHGLRGAFEAAAKKRRQGSGMPLTDEGIAVAFAEFEAYWESVGGVRPEAGNRRGSRDPNDPLRLLTLDYRNRAVLYRRGKFRRRFPFRWYDSIEACIEAAIEFRDQGGDE